MKELLLLLLHFLTAVARLLGGGGAKALVAENLLIIARTFGVEIDKDVVRRVLAKHYRPKPGAGGPSWLTFFEYHRWQANLRVLDVEEIKTVPYVPLSHRFVERLIGTIQQEFFDQTLFWNSVDLESKLLEFRDYYNRERVHSGIGGSTPCEAGGALTAGVVKLGNFRCQAAVGTSINFRPRREHQFATHTQPDASIVQIYCQINGF